MNENESSGRFLEEAMDWLLRVSEAPDDPDLRRQVEAWVAADPEHRRAWNQARETWQTMAGVQPATNAAWESDAAPGRATGPGPAPSLEASVRARASRPRSRKRFALTAAAVAVAACLALVFAPTVAVRMQADFVTATAELRQVTLEDGSVVHLAPESAIELRFTDDRRDVTLLAGDAFFRVTPDPLRPFVVTAEDLGARAIGTAFGVGISTRSISVEVESGVVGVRADSARPPIDERVDIGHALRFDRAAKTHSLQRMSPGDMAAWRFGKLWVVDASVGEVVETLRRYRSGWIVIADDRLARQRVNGIYDLRNPDSALRALVHPAGGQVHTITPLLRVLR